MLSGGVGGEIRSVQGSMVAQCLSGEAGMHKFTEKDKKERSIPGDFSRKHDAKKLHCYARPITMSPHNHSQCHVLQIRDPTVS